MDVCVGCDRRLVSCCLWQNHDREGVFVLALREVLEVVGVGNFPRLVHAVQAPYLAFHAFVCKPMGSGPVDDHPCGVWREDAGWVIRSVPNGVVHIEGVDVPLCPQRRGKDGFGVPARTRDLVVASVLGTALELHLRQEGVTRA